MCVCVCACVCNSFEMICNNSYPEFHKNSNTFLSHRIE